MPGSIGPLEIALVLLIALVVFGPKRLPELGKGLGRGMRDFKRAVTGDDDDERQEDEERAKQAQLAAAAVAPPVVPTPPTVVVPVAVPTPPHGAGTVPAAAPLPIDVTPPADDSVVR